MFDAEYIILFFLVYVYVTLNLINGQVNYTITQIDTYNPLSVPSGIVHVVKLSYLTNETSRNMYIIYSITISSLVTAALYSIKQYILKHAWS